MVNSPPRQERVDPTAGQGAQHLDRMRAERRGRPGRFARVQRDRNRVAGTRLGRVVPSLGERLPDLADGRSPDCRLDVIPAGLRDHLPEEVGLPLPGRQVRVPTVVPAIEARVDPAEVGPGPLGRALHDSAFLVMRAEAANPCVEDRARPCTEQGLAHVEVVLGGKGRHLGDPDWKRRHEGSVDETAHRDARDLERDQLIEDRRRPRGRFEQALLRREAPPRHQHAVAGHQAGQP